MQVTQRRGDTALFFLDCGRGPARQFGVSVQGGLFEDWLHGPQHHMMRAGHFQQLAPLLVAEGAHPRDGGQYYQLSTRGEHRLGGIGEVVAREVAERSGKETRYCILGHLQRGGAPDSLDRILGIRFGVKAVSLIAEQRFGRMVSYQNYEVADVSIAEAVHHLRLVDPKNQLVETARAVDITFGD